MNIQYYDTRVVAVMRILQHYEFYNDMKPNPFSENHPNFHSIQFFNRWIETAYRKDEQHRSSEGGKSAVMQRRPAAPALDPDSF